MDGDLDLTERAEESARRVLRPPPPSTVSVHLPARSTEQRGVKLDGEATEEQRAARRGGCPAAAANQAPVDREAAACRAFLGAPERRR